MLKKQKGFTLIELLVVIAIIGLLSAIVLASLSVARSKGDDGRRLSDMSSVVQALELYATDNKGNYPATPAADPGNLCGGNATCVDQLTTLTTGKYIPYLPKDPYAAFPGTLNNYRYCANGTKDYILLIHTEALHGGVWCRPQTPVTSNACGWAVAYPSC